MTDPKKCDTSKEWCDWCSVESIVCSENSCDVCRDEDLPKSVMVSYTQHYSAADIVKEYEAANGSRPDIYQFLAWVEAKAVKDFAEKPVDPKHFYIQNEEGNEL